MSPFDYSRVISHRSSQAVFTAIILVVLLIWAVFLKKPQEDRHLVKSIGAIAVIKEIKTSVSKNSHTTTTSHFVTLKLIDEEKSLKFMLTKPPPAVGSQVPILIDIYDDGSKFYHYRLVDWYAY